MRSWLRPPRPPPRARAFTLLELLVVIAVLSTLVAISLPLINLASRESRKSATRVVMVKVDTALRLFRSEIGPYPYQQTYADLAAGEVPTNRLNYHLGTDLADDQRAKVLADADTAAARYQESDSFRPTPADPNSYRQADCVAGLGEAKMCNRLARERVRLAVFSGHTGITGGKLKDPVHMEVNFTWTVFARRALPTTPLLAAPVSAAAPGPGWAKDYLGGEVPKRHVDGQAILDAWNRPLIYVCQVVEGVRSVPLRNSSEGGCSFSNALNQGLHPLGRRTLAPEDAITGEPLVAAPPALPDPANLRHSDRRSHAPRRLELEFELWSAGPDGSADWMRDGLANRDNVPLQDYDRGLP